MSERHSISRTGLTLWAIFMAVMVGGLIWIAEAWATP